MTQCKKGGQHDLYRHKGNQYCRKCNRHIPDVKKEKKGERS